MSDNRQSQFDKWMARVDAIMARKYGLTHRDIADWQWWDSFEADDSPAQAVNASIHNELNS